MKKSILAIFALAVSAFPQAPTYTIDQSVIASGGGTSTEASGQFNVTGAIGQSVTATSTTPPYKINSGFFTAPALAPTAARVSVGGRVTTATGNGIRGARVTLATAGGEVGSVVTGAFGYFNFTDVAAGETYILTVTAKRFKFTDPSQIRTVLEDTDDVVFIAEAP